MQGAFYIDWNMIAPLVIISEKVEEQVQKLDQKLESLEKKDCVVKRLMTHPGVGPFTAMAYKAEIIHILRLYWDEGN